MTLPPKAAVVVLLSCFDVIMVSEDDDGLDFNFVIPQKLEDLCTYSKERYVVGTDYSSTEVQEKIPGEFHLIMMFTFNDSFPDAAIYRSSNERGPALILEDFDVFYGVLKHFKTIPSSIREQAWKTILQSANTFMRDLQDDLNESSQNLDSGGDGGLSGRKRKCNIIKMIVYIFCNMIELFEDLEQKKSTSIEAVVEKGRGKKTTTKSDESLVWERNREKGVETLSGIALMSLHKLFASETVAKDELINLMTRSCYAIITNPAAKGKDNVKKHVYDIITNAVCRHNQSLNFVLKVISLLQVKQKECFYLKDLLNIVEILVTQHDRKLTVAELVMELNRVDLSKETSVKAISDFLKELGDRVPAAFIPCITTLLDDFLDADAYMIRSSTLSIFGGIISSELSNEEATEKQKKLRDNLMDRLEEHLMDVTTFTRGRAIQVWTKLCLEGKIPLSRMHTLIEMIVKRLRDKSGYVRKAAIIFLTEFLRLNPFAAKLSLERLQEAYQMEKTKLDEMTSHGEEDVGQPTATLIDKWKDLEEAFISFWSGSSSQGVDENITDEEDEEMNTESSASKDEDPLPNLDPQDYDSLEASVEVVRTLLQKKKFRETLDFVKGLRKRFDKHQVFAPEEDSSSEEEDDDPIPNTSSSKSSLPASILFTKRIFLLGETEAAKKDTLENMNDAKRMEVMAEKLVNRGQKRKLEDVEGDGDDNTLEIEEEEVVVNDLSKQQMLVKYLHDCVCFAQQIKNAIPDICSMLGSKTITDSQEAIDFFVTAYEFGVQGSLIGIRKMITLVFSMDKAIRDAVLEAYKKLYLTSPSLEALSSRQKAVSVVKNLMELVEGASIGELTSLEELLTLLMGSAEIGSEHIKVLFEKYARKYPLTTEVEARTACQLIAMLATSNRKIITDNLDTLIQVGLIDHHQDSQLVQHTLSALQRSATKEPKVEDKTVSFRLSKNHKLFERIHSILVEGISNLGDDFFLPMANEAVKTVYCLAEQPDDIIEEILHGIMKVVIPEGTLNDSIDSLGSAKENEDTNTITLSQPLSQEDGDADRTITEETVNASVAEVPPEVLSRLISILGDVALNQLVHIESSILTEIKIRKYIKECKEAEKKGKTAAPPTTSRKRQSIASATSSNMEEEIGLAGANAVEDEIEQFRVFRMIDDNKNLLGRLAFLITDIVQNPDRFSDQKLKNTASLALAKFMLCSQVFCEKNLRLLFTVLQKSQDSMIRQNAIISLGDLCVRYPNLLDPWTGQLYAPLNDKDVEVRRNSLKVLSRLILSDMVKVKGQIYELAKIIVDDDDSLAMLAKLFFQELKKKENAIYNVLPDIISNLSGGEQEMDERKFQDVMMFLIPLVDKDKQVVSLIDKICQRFRGTHDERQWRDLTFCLTKMKFSDQGVKTLVEHMMCFADKLHCDPVYEGFKGIADEAEKLSNIKDIVESFKSKIEECRTKGVAKEDESEIQKVVGTPPSAKKPTLAAGRGSTVKKTLDLTKTTGRTSAKKTQPKRKTRRKAECDEDDFNEEDEDEVSDRKPSTSRSSRDVPSKAPAREPPQRTNTRPTRSGRRRIAELFEDDDDDSD